MRTETELVIKSRRVVPGRLLAGGFETIGDANTSLPDWLLVTAGRRIHGTTGRPPRIAIRNPPRLNLSSLPSGLRVPSG